jgi:hypothetical protein
VPTNRFFHERRLPHRQKKGGGCIDGNVRAAAGGVGMSNKCRTNQHFAAMAPHYLFGADFCNPAVGWRTAHVAGNVLPRMDIVGGRG